MARFEAEAMQFGLKAQQGILFFRQLELAVPACLQREAAFKVVYHHYAGLLQMNGNAERAFGRKIVQRATGILIGEVLGENVAGCMPAI